MPKYAIACCFDRSITNARVQDYRWQLEWGDLGKILLYLLLDQAGQSECALSPKTKMAPWPPVAKSSSYMAVDAHFRANILASSNVHPLKCFNFSFLFLLVPFLRQSVSDFLLQSVFTLIRSAATPTLSFENLPTELPRNGLMWVLSLNHHIQGSSICRRSVCRTEMFPSFCKWYAPPCAWTTL